MFDTATTSEAARTGISLGTVIAVVASWHRNKSIIWAIFHGFLSWVYVIYYVCTDPKENITLRTIFYIIVSIILVHVLIIGGVSAYSLLK